MKTPFEKKALPTAATEPMSLVCHGAGGKLRLLTKLALATALFTYPGSAAMACTVVVFVSTNGPV